MRQPLGLAKDADYEGAKGSTKGLMAGEPNRATSSRIQQSLPPGGSKRHTCWIPNSHCSLGMMETIKGDMEAEIANGKKQDKENQACQDQLVGDSFCVSTPSIMLI